MAKRLACLWRKIRLYNLFEMKEQFSDTYNVFPRSSHTSHPMGLNDPKTNKIYMQKVVYMDELF